MVQQELKRKDMASGEPKAERPWFIRRAGERVYVVSGEFQAVSLGGRRWIGRGPRGRADGQQCCGPCVAWWLVRCPSVVRAVSQPYQQRADLPALRLRFPSGEDYCSLTTLRLSHLPSRFLEARDLKEYSPEP